MCFKVWGWRVINKAAMLRCPKDNGIVLGGEDKSPPYSLAETPLSIHYIHVLISYFIIFPIFLPLM